MKYRVLLIVASILGTAMPWGASLGGLQKDKKLPEANFGGALIFDNDPGIKQTIAYVQKLQTSTGGFTSIPPAPNIRIAPTLRATSAAVRALHYLGGTIPDKPAAVKFVERCWNPATGGSPTLPAATTSMSSRRRSVSWRSPN